MRAVPRPTPVTSSPAAALLSAVGSPAAAAQQPGLMVQMTAVAVGSAVGHTLGQAILGVFSGGSSISTADGSASVKLGNTTVVCGVKAEFAAPPSDAPDKGCVVRNVDLPPLCSSRFRSGPPGEEAQVASQFIADVIENSQIIQKEDSCISSGKLAWVLYCDLICLDYGVLDTLTKVLVALCEEPEKPNSALDFLKHHLGVTTAENPEIELLCLELAEMKEKYEATGEENKKLKAKLAQYEPPQEEERAK
ncbi:Exosome complex component RRP43 [Sciurus carolinensis]|uniref:Ribosomal RNA-processing protein 43 n=1 Tax=Sciurus carolinensis TaxID=30640 RepID=A0AA41MT58_SCICA|nr:Exosome complex component RRP43 [Sciurus carolinensis]